MKLKATLLAVVVIVAAVLACGGTETPATAPSRETPAFTQPLESQLLAPTTSRSLTSVPVSTQPPTDLSQFSPTPTHIVHIVQSGETLGRIAKQYGVSVEALVAVNNIADPGLIRVGQILVIPPADAIVTSPPTGTPAQASSQPGATSIATFDEKEQMLLIFLGSLTEDPLYDPDADVLHKYLPTLDIHLADAALTFTLSSEPETEEEFVRLGGELLLSSALLSEREGWHLARIELVLPGPYDSSVTLYVAGNANLARLAEGSVGVYDIMQTNIDWGYASTPPSSGALLSPTQEPPQPICECSYNAYNCGDFATQAAAQACFNYCWRVVGYDVHWLDDDKDGIACEWNP